MKVDVVVDVGNSRIKWGRCTPQGVTFLASLPPSDRAVWQEQWEWSGLTSELCWAVSGVAPTSRDHFAKWLTGRAKRVVVLQTFLQLPLVEVRVDFPSKVGIDRLLDAVAANSRVRRDETKIIVDVGTAVTVDCVDAHGVFRGGAVFPGFRLMTQALHDHTGLLPKVEITDSNPPVPATTTEAAISAGVFWSVAGGIKALIRGLVAATGQHNRTIFLTGGDSALLLPVMDADVVHWPEMTLEGIRLAAESLPEPGPTPT